MRFVSCRGGSFNAYSQKEILILGVEFERDFGNDVSENLYWIYKAITDENTMLNDTQPEMTM